MYFSDAFRNNSDRENSPMTNMMMNRIIGDGSEKEAKELAMKQIANMLQRPDQLEKIEPLKRRVKRNIVSF